MTGLTVQNQRFAVGILTHGTLGANLGLQSNLSAIGPFTDRSSWALPGFLFNGRTVGISTLGTRRAVLGRAAVLLTVGPLTDRTLGTTGGNRNPPAIGPLTNGTGRAWTGRDLNLSAVGPPADRSGRTLARRNLDLTAVGPLADGSWRTLTRRNLDLTAVGIVTYRSGRAVAGRSGIVGLALTVPEIESRRTLRLQHQLAQLFGNHGNRLRLIVTEEGIHRMTARGGDDAYPIGDAAVVGHRLRAGHMDPGPEESGFTWHQVERIGVVGTTVSGTVEQAIPGTAKGGG